MDPKPSDWANVGESISSLVVVVTLIFLALESILRALIDEEEL
jgi:hypothetical protein